MSRVLAFVPDLIDRSKVAAAADDVRFVAGPAALRAELAGDPDVELVVVDLGRPGAIDAVTELRAEPRGERPPAQPSERPSERPGLRIVGFGSHVERDLLAAARAAGCDEVLARSAFFGRLDDLLQPPDAGASG